MHFCLISYLIIFLLLKHIAVFTRYILLIFYSHLTKVQGQSNSIALRSLMRIIYSNILCMKTQTSFVPLTILQIKVRV